MSLSQLHEPGYETRKTDHGRGRKANGLLDQFRVCECCVCGTKQPGRSFPAGPCHRSELRGLQLLDPGTMAKMFFHWAVGRRYTRANPFAAVKPVGKVHAGKDQLRIDEARQLTETLISAAKQGEEGAIATYTQLVLGAPNLTSRFGCGGR